MGKSDKMCGGAVQFSWELALVVCVLLLPRLGFAEYRTWTSVSGVQVEARMVREWLGTVHLEDRDGGEFQITLPHLSAADQEYVSRQIVAARRSGRRSTSNEGEGASTTASRSVPARPQERPLPPVGLVRGDAEVAATMRPDSVITRTAEGEEGVPYHLYVPPQFDPQRPPPILILFDPTGNGRGMLGQVQQSAAKAGWIAIGVDRLKNRAEGANVGRMEDEVLADIFTRIPHNGDRVYLGGFSGGALRAFRLSSQLRAQRPIAGVFSYGGWLGGERGRQWSFPANMAVAFINGADDTAANHQIEGDTAALRGSRRVIRVFSFPGGHVVAPALVTDEVMAWMETVAPGR